MGSLLPWLAIVAFSTLVAVALIVLGFRNAIRALALGYLAVLLVFFPAIALQTERGPLRMILAAIAVSALFAIPAIFLSVLGAALLLALPCHQRLAGRLTSIMIGVAFGILGGFLLGEFKISSGSTRSPWWAALTLGAVVGACWGILAPSFIRPNKPLQPTSGGRADGGCGSMGSAARGRAARR